ncbi:MAG: hypothetical protein JNL54_22260 [Kineosporiaceae bacterium]|nr:hypothetical protein [Kineosporiaceae bacterium]
MARRRSAPLTGVIVTYPDGGPAGLRSRHLLMLPSTVSPRDVGELLRSRVPDARLETQGIARLGRHCRVYGPFELSMEDAVDAGVPMPWTLVYALDAPVERDLPPHSGEDDRDGFAHAFPQGLPWREEGRALQLLVGLARRLQGAVRVHGTGVVIQPDPMRGVDLLLHSPTWLEPHVVQGIVARVVPGAELAVDGQEWHGPDAHAYAGAYTAHATADDPLTPAELQALHAMADQVDLAALRAADTIDAFAVVAEFPGPAWIPGGVLPDHRDGAIEVLVHVSDPGEPSVAGQDWGAHPFVTYEVRWACAQPEERERRLPSSSYLASRERVQPLVAAVARALVEAAGGVVTDEEGFLVDRYHL